MLLKFSRKPWVPGELFSLGELGAWYDPSDLSTMFQDSAGTTPVTAAGQPVGLLLDKSKGLALGPELVTNGTFDSDTGWSVVAGIAIGGGTANYTAVSGNLQSNGGGYVTGKTYRVTFTITAISGGSITPWIRGTYASISYSAVGTYTTHIIAGGSTDLLLLTGVACTGSVDNISVKEVAGNHASQATSASRPVLQVDGNGKYYLDFDGVDDSMATAAINFSATNKMSVFAGVRKDSDAAQGVVCELSATIATNAGSFLLTAPNSAAANYNWSSKGTVQADNTVVTYTAPITNVLACTADISSDSNSIKVNGGTATTVATDQGTGNYGNFAMYIGSRGGTTLPLNGRIYSLIVRGALSTAAEVAAAEAYVNSKTGAY